MNATLSKLFIFAAGAVIGSAVTAKLVKDKYEKISREEIESVREMYANKVNEYHISIKNAEADQIIDDVCGDLMFPTSEEKDTYADIVKNYKKGDSNDMEIGTQPYVISYEEFGEIEEYDSTSLTFYSDGIIADDWGDIIEDIPNTIGDDFSRHYDENEDDPDIVYVRNDILKTDYEIARDIRKFSEVNLTDNTDE